MSELDRLALGVLLPGFAGTTLPDDHAALLAEGLAGACLFGSNTADGPDALARLTASLCEAAGARVVVAVDEEGGDVTRLHATGLSPVLGAAALGAADDLGLTRHTGRAVAAELAAVGVTLDLGPVADVNSRAENPVIGTRSFGTDPARVADHVAAWVEGLQAGGVAACAKHFPGHGDTAQDSHLELPRLDVDETTLLERELVPFAAAVRAGAAAVMTSHVVVEALDPDLPATLSAPVLALLRDRIGHDGVVVSDALDMAGASGDRGIPEAAVLSLAAGADLLCLGPERSAASVREVQHALTVAVAEGRLPEERLRAAAARVARLREGLRPSHQHRPDEVSPDPARQLEGARRATTVDGVLPDLRGARVVSVATTPNIAVGDVPWGLPPDLVVAPGAGLPDDLGPGPLVLQVRDAHRRPDVLGLLATLGDRPAVVVEWGWPAPWDGALPRICPHGSSGPGVDAVTEIVRKAGWER
ncbi:glycoside hydrolase family 3 protein [Nocardioides sp. SYSU D00038]|uniref:glycoside hydrolase family 3 protein n=1 Tax=Nocardioides sp. SYSU D00038 TaxID=2812554 RepID=UPI0019680349|nr:glycoside hydrolase family 3 protein [Nocardioides sp. SYSU D00038]